MNKSNFWELIISLWVEKGGNRLFNVFIIHHQLGNLTKSSSPITWTMIKHVQS